MSKVIFVYKKSPTSEYIDKYSDEYIKTHYTEEAMKDHHFRFSNSNHKSAEKTLFCFIFECHGVSYDTKNYSTNYDLFAFVDSDLHENYEETLLVYKKVAEAFDINEFESFKIEEIPENKPYKPRNFPWDTRGWQPK